MTNALRTPVPNDPSSDAKTVVSLRRASGHRKKAEAVYRRVNAKTLDSDKKGSRLLAVINRVMAKNNHTIEDVAAVLNISPVYLRAIASGSRSFADVDRSILRCAAEYVGMPVAQVFLLSDAMNPEDFFFARTVEDEVNAAREAMITNPVWSGYAPSSEEWANSTLRQKIFVTMLFEAATGQTFLTSAEIPMPEAG